MGKAEEKVVLGKGFVYQDEEKILTMDEVLRVYKDGDSFFTQYAEIMWLNNYFANKSLSRSVTIPSITSVISDEPMSGNRNNESKVEKYVIKTVEAQEWLNEFHKALGLLPEELQELIKAKYLKRNRDGSRVEDVLVYEELAVSRSKYYTMKKQALIELGRRLYGG